MPKKGVLVAYEKHICKIGIAEENSKITNDKCII